MNNKFYAETHEFVVLKSLRCDISEPDCPCIWNSVLFYYSKLFYFPMGEQFYVKFK